MITYPIEMTDYTKKLMEPIKKAAYQLRGSEPGSLPYSAYKIFHETGSRIEYETPYMRHRKMLCAFAGMVFSGDESFIPDLSDIIWAICDEYTWSLPAHIAKNATPEAISGCLDLFSCETSMALSEISAAIGHLLPKTVTDRIKYEVTRRIFDPYEKTRKKFGYNNWSAVCACGIGCSMLVLGETERFERVKDSLLSSLDDFLVSFNDDGCCMEGSLYWSYGFGFFTFFADALREYTKGGIDYFKDEKVKKIAFFGPSSHLSGRYVVSFSDSPHEMKYEPGVWHFLAKEYDGFGLPDEEFMSTFGDDVRYRFAPFIRALCYAPPKDAKRIGTGNQNPIFYENAGWYISRPSESRSYAFAAKAGDNDEPHNHGDVGSFLVLDGDEFILDDLGWSAYTKEYFDPKFRYGHLNVTSSYGHSLPIVDGKDQKPGKESKGIVTGHTENTFALEFSSAYGLESLTKLTRRFELSENEIVITDEAEGGFETLTERFVPRIKPETDGNSVRIGSWHLTCGARVQISLSSFDYKPRFAGNGAEDVVETAYLIDFNVKKAGKFRFSLTKSKIS